MNKEQITNEVIGVIKELNLINNTENIDMKVPLKDGLGINSLLLVKLLVNIEDKYDFEFDDNQLDIKAYNCLDEVIDVIVTHLNE